MVEELADEGHAGRHIRVVGVVRAEDSRLCDRQDGIAEVVVCIDDPALHAELFRLFAGFVGQRTEGRQAGKHSCEGVARLPRMSGPGDVDGIGP